MSDAALAKTNRLARKAKAAKRKIASFESRFGPAHQVLLYQAAFPLALTPDLLYRLWASFQRDINGQFLNIPWVAVSDILLSDICEEVGQEIYEMDTLVRDELLKRLQDSASFGQRRIQELSDFLLEYVQQHLNSNDLDIRDFAQAQRWTVLAYTKPTLAARELALTFQMLSQQAAAQGQQNPPELIRMAAVVDALAEPLAETDSAALLAYARSMNSLAKGNHQQAATQLAQIAESGRVHIAGVTIPLPKGIEAYSDQLKPSVAVDYSGQNLRGRSFRGRDLTGANFSNANLHSADFTQATLVDADFSQAKTGLQRRWAALLIFSSILLSVLSGLAATGAGFLGGLGIGEFFYSRSLEEADPTFQYVLLAGFVCFLVLCITTFKRKLTVDWSAGILAMYGTSLMIALLQSSTSMAPLYGVRGRLYAIASAAIAWLLVIALAKVTTGKLRSRTTAWIGGATGLSLVLVLWRDESEVPYTLMLLALLLIASALAIGIAWSANRTESLSISAAKAGIFSIVVALISSAVFIGLFGLFVASDWLWAIAFVVFTAVLALTTTVPFVIAGLSSLQGALVGTLVAPTILVATFILPETLFTEQTLLSDFSVTIRILFITIGTIVLLAWATTIVIAVAVNLAWVEAENKAIALGLTSLCLLPPMLCGMYISYLINQKWLRAIEGMEPVDFAIATISGILIATLVLSLGTYIGWRSLQNDPKLLAIRTLASTFAAKGGTSFRKANLTHANFTEATLKSADFTNATLTNTCWFHTQKLNYACFTGNTLQQPQIQQLAATAIGQAQNFDHLNLQGIRLQQASLTDASFIGTNLQRANLKDADLSRAQLIQTQLQQADLFGTCLTGAFIQDIQITVETKLRGVECQYIFTRLPTPDNPDPGRIPTDHRQIFRPGEFAQYARQTFLPGSSATAKR
ncbi:MAG: pentapeptide repeat-containing protein [Phormidesmis sp.]